MSPGALVASKESEQESQETYNDGFTSEPVPPADIVSFNELRSCADLYRLYATDKLEIQPDFQREVVWKPEEQTRFIDSLVKQLPIPSMCFSLDYKTQKWKVIDGLQRMSSIISFLGDAPWKLKGLDDIHPTLRGRTNVWLRTDKSEGSRLFSTVQDVSIPITVLRCDYSQPAHMHYLFTIFHRLNSGGVRLNNQEIRNCIYNGPFNSALKEFDRTNKDWAKVKRSIWGSPTRFRSVELLLRALAFSDNFENYDGNLARFLNTYMHTKMDLDGAEISHIEARLGVMSSAATKALGDARRKVSLTFIEAVLVGILRNLGLASSMSAERLTQQFSAMLEEPAFSDAAKYAIAGERNVKTRMKVAETVFARW